MLNTLGIVEVRRGAVQPDSKVDRKLGGKSLLEWVVRRVTDCQRLDSVVVALEDTPQDRRIAELVPSDVPVFIGLQSDALGRLMAVLQQTPARAVLRVCADNPFIDPVLIDRLVTTAAADPRCDYLSYCSADGQPAILTPLGVFAEWCSAAALRRADREATLPADRDQVTRYLYSHREKFHVRLIPIPPELDREDVRLKMDSEEDWEHTQVIYDALGCDEWDWQRIADLLDHQPALRERMAVLNRHHAKV